MSSETLNIKVRHGAMDLHLSVSAGTTFREVKVIVEHEWDVPVDHQRFLFAGREHADDQTLAASGVADGFVLLLFPPNRSQTAKAALKAMDAESWLQGNRLQQHFSSSDLAERFRMYREANLDLRAAFEHCRQPHNVPNATKVFQELFFSSRLQANDDLPLCRKRLAVLDGLTEALVTSDAPCDGDEAIKAYRTMMLSIGSRWLTALAFFSTRFETNGFAAIVHARLTGLMERAVKPQIFRRGFSILLDLTCARNSAETKTQFLNACSDLHRSIRRRLEHHVRLPESETDFTRRYKFNDVHFKDSIMVPYLRQILQSQAFPEEEFTEAMFQANICAFFHFPNAENWDRAFRRNPKVEDLRRAFDYVKCCMEASYTFSTRRKKRFERFANLTVCHLHVARATYVEAERRESALATALKGVQAMAEIEVSPSMVGTLTAFRERFTTEVGKVSVGVTRLLYASKILFAKIESVKG